MDRLFTPWRFAYVTGEQKEEGCVFCNRLDCDETANFVLHRGRHWYLILNLFPYNSGHLLLVLNRHQPLLSGCSPEELVEMSRLTGIMERLTESISATTAEAAPAPVSPNICTCTCCRAGPGTRIS